LLFSTLASAAVVGQQLFDDPEQRGDQTGGNEGDTVQISTPLGPIVGRIVSEAGSEGENKHIQGGSNSRASYNFLSLSYERVVR
jgi:hypothetical protein